MKKFKVGQKVKLKSAYELTKITNYKFWSPYYKSLAGKIVEIYEISGFGNNLYRVKNENEFCYYLFAEDLFEEDLFEPFVEI